MHFGHASYAALLLALAACAPPPTIPGPTTQSSIAPVAVSGANAGIDASGRATGPLNVNGFVARPSPGHPTCLVLNRPGAAIPYSLQSAGTFIGLGGQCPSLYWRATFRSLEEFGEGIINVEGIGRCRISRLPGVQGGGGGTCDRV